MTGSKKVVRLSKAAREFNISIDSVVIFLKDRGYEIERNPNTKLEPEMYNQLSEEFRVEKEVKEISRKKDLEYVGKDSISIDNTVAKPTGEEAKPHVEEELMIKNIGVAFTSTVKSTEDETPKVEVVEEKVEQNTPPVEEDNTADSNTVTSDKVLEEALEEPKDEVKDEVLEATNIEEEEPIAPVVVSEEKETTEAPEDKVQEDESSDLKVLGKIDLENLNQKTRPKKKSKEEKRKEQKEKQDNKTKAKKKEEKPVKEVPESAEETKEVTKKIVEEKAKEVSSKNETTEDGEVKDKFIKTTFYQL